MSLQRIAEELAERHGIDSRQAYRILLSGLQLIERETIASGRCIVRGVGVFHLKRTAERKGRNPRTGEPVTVPARLNIVFRHATDRARALQGRLSDRRRAQKAP